MLATKSIHDYVMYTPVKGGEDFNCPFGIYTPLWRPYTLRLGLTEPASFQWTVDPCNVYEILG